jgi:hypothetical protein
MAEKLDAEKCLVCGSAGDVFASFVPFKALLTEPKLTQRRGEKCFSNSCASAESRFKNILMILVNDLINAPDTIIDTDDDVSAKTAR